MDFLRFKRFTDILLSFIGLILLSPFFIVIIIIIKLDSKGPVFFVQERYGLNKSVFKIYKFRTMIVDTPKNCPTHLLNDHEKHITRYGKYLRKASLDELPQLLNILKGDMSIVGPRPVVLRETELIKERDKYGANDIRPGLTGWAQINGRDNLHLKDKARYDGEYVENMGIIMDIKCFFGTLASVFQKGAVLEGSQEYFKNVKEDIKENIEESIMGNKKIY